MRIKAFQNKTRKFTDLDNMFNIYQDKNSNYFFNLNSTMYIQVNDNSLKTFTIDHDMHWPLISYKIYKTTRLFWLLMKLNKVDAKNSFDIIHAGTAIKYLDSSYITNIISQMDE